MNCKVADIQSPIDINVASKNFNRAMFDNNLKILYKDITEPFKFKWKSNVGFFIDLIQEGKEEEVFSKLNLDGNLLNEGYDVVWKISKTVSAKYKLVRI
mmetsp:Transcript_45671/g.99808  ORF Transcript_45671/g.99808 Transcript_45671/m.99808 type:complete len:99 (+) Transcript_45671:357-653(+)